MAVFSRVKTWVSNEVLTASDLNAEFNNLLNNTIPASIEDQSADVATMQATADPGGVGTESLATSLAGEIQRLRFAIKRIVGGDQWYSTPDFDLTGTLGTSNIADGAITPAKKASLGQQISSSSGNFTGSSASIADVTNLTVTITSTGRPIFVGIIPISGGSSYIGIQRSDTEMESRVYIVRDASEAGRIELRCLATGASAVKNFYPPSSVFMVDPQAAGTYVYKIQYQTSFSTNSPLVSFFNCKLIAYEL